MPGAITNKARRPKARTKTRELISRWGTIREWDASIFINADTKHGKRERNSMRCLEFRGVLTRPVKCVSEFKLTVFAEADPTVGKAEIASVGSIIAMRPTMGAVVSLAEREFQLLVTMAAAGRAASVHMSLQEPRYGSALIASCSFSSKPPEDD